MNQLWPQSNYFLIGHRALYFACFSSEFHLVGKEGDARTKPDFEIKTNAKARVSALVHLNYNLFIFVSCRALAEPMFAMHSSLNCSNVLRGKILCVYLASLNWYSKF